MNDRKRAIRYGGFLVGWTILNIVQAICTDLWHDEAYYWMYAQHLDWGYFDHPPMIAAWIRAGYAMFPNEFGVRLLSVLSNTAVMALLWKLADDKAGADAQKSFLFWAIVAAIAPVQLAGYLAVPDSPLLFFVVIFYFFYKKYLQSDTWQHTLLLAISIAAMLYSKYHGILVVAFTVLSNISLLRRRSFYGIAAMAIVLLLPHIWWQHTHGYPSLYFHLSDRSSAPYSPLFTAKYIGGQLLLAGPIIAIPLLWLAASFRPKNALNRAYKWNFIGTMVFFALMSFKGEVEANWTFMAFVPMILLSYERLQDMDSRRLWKKWVLRTLPVSIVLLLIGRVYFVYDFLPAKWVPRHEYHKQREWAQTIAQAVGDKPMVFYDSYQNAAKYTFYTGKFAHSLSSHHGRLSQYDLWQNEKPLQGKPAAISANWLERHQQLVVLPYGDTMSFSTTEHFYSYGRVKIEPILKELHVARSAKRVILPVKIIAPQGEIIRWQYDASEPELFCRIADGSHELSDIGLKIYPSQLPMNMPVSVAIPISLKKGKYNLRLGIATDWRVPALNMRSIPLIVE